MHTYWSILFVLLAVKSIRMSPVVNNNNDSQQDGNLLLADNDEYYQEQKELIYIIKNIIADESNSPQIQNLLLNQLREDLNQMCVQGYFGQKHSQQCRRILDYVHHHQNSIQQQHPFRYSTSDETDLTDTRQKRFFL